MQCHENSWREIARSNQKRGQPADEHGGNQRRSEEQSSDEKLVMANPRIAIRQKSVAPKWFMSKPGEQLKTEMWRPCVNLTLRFTC
jgi:hypothetical protein